MGKAGSGSRSLVTRWLARWRPNTKMSQQKWINSRGQMLVRTLRTARTSRPFQETGPSSPAAAPAAVAAEPGPASARAAGSCASAPGAGSTTSRAASELVFAGCWVSPPLASELRMIEE